MLTVLGLSQQSAPVDVRERLAIPEASLPETLHLLGQGVILSTCNRTEIYVDDVDPSAASTARAFLESRLDNLPGPSPRLSELKHLSAVRHLFAVASGLDSMVLGEPQILGQIRSALAAAEAAGTAGPVLSRAFRDALRAGRRARLETFVGRHAVSVSYAAVELARGVVGPLNGRRALVVGAGEMGELTTRTLIGHGVGVVAVANRTFDRAASLARRVGGEAVAFEDLISGLRSADIVITSTDALQPIISRDIVEAAVRDRAERPLVLIDIAVPRDVHPSVRDLDNVVLYDIDDLKARCDHNRAERHREVHRVREIIEQEVQRFAEWWREREAIPSVIELRARADQLRREELAEARRHLRHLGDDDWQTIDTLTRAIVNKLLHEPTVRVKARAGSETVADNAVEAFRDLFDLG